MIKIICFLFTLSFGWGQSLPEPRGFYSSGHLLNGWELPNEGEGYVRLFSYRNRGWGTQQIIEMIEKSAFEINQLFPAKDRLLVGDISALKGGRISGHGSHQNGLDVELAFYRLDGVEQSADYRNGFLENMVKKGKISKNFDVVRNWELVKSLHRFGRVNRIFIDKVIKKELCKHAEFLGEKDSYVDVLKSLRPYPYHGDHLHVRIECPENAPKCRNQIDHGEGVGC